MQTDLFSQVEIIQPMTKNEAEEWERRVGTAAKDYNAAANQLRIVLAEGYEREAWRIRGYSSWSEHLRVLAERFGFSGRYIEMLHSANQTEKTLLPNHGSVGQIPERQLRPLSQLETPEQKREAWRQAQETAPAGKLTGAHVQKVVQEYKAQVTRPKQADYITVDTWQHLTESERQEALETVGQATFNRQNTNTYGDTEGGGDIEWALWSWNPVTGCLHNCPYCYARDIANRFYEQKFEPALIPSRLSAPVNTKAPDISRVDNPVMRMGLQNVFTCSMADLFGKWVPAEWIEAVLEQIRNNPQWNFLLLTKFPVRMAEFDYPPNVWLGTSVDHQWAVERAEKAFKKIKASGFSGVCWLSCEPMMERLTFSSLNMFDWVVIGGASRSTQTKEFRPSREWVNHLEAQAEQAGAKVYEKTNLLERIREYPA